MKVERSTVLDGSVGDIYSLVTKLSTLSYISRPLLTFTLISEGEVTWRVGDIHEFRLRSFGFLPMGRHRIEIAKVSENHISSVESGTLAKTWLHDIYLSRIDENKTTYTDLVEIKSGILTPFIWIFAKVFYGHRQRRWKKLLKLHQNKQ